MKNLRFKFVVATSPLFVATHIPRANYMIKHKEKYTEQQRYDFAMKIENHMRRRARTKTDVFGRENLPQDGKTLIPVWAFQINEKPLNDSEYQYELRVNAITGKIIVQ